MPNAETSTPVQEIVPLLYVEDIAMSEAFYKEKLGFTQTTSWKPGGVLKWCRLDRDGVGLMLQLAEAEEFAGKTGERGRGVTFFFNCEDVDAIRDQFAASGFRLPVPEVAFYGMKQLEFTDPDGYQLCFQSPAEAETDGSSAK